MAVEHLQAAEEVLLLQVFDRVEDFTDRESELAPKAGRAGPPADARGREPGADPEVGEDVVLRGRSLDQAELMRLLDYRDDVAPHLRGENHRLDVFGILETVAHEGHLVEALCQRESRDQLRLRADLQPEAQLRSEVPDHLADVALLIDFYGVDAGVSGAVPRFLDGVVEGASQLAHAVLENTWEANDDRRRDLTSGETPHDVMEVDRLPGVSVRVGFERSGRGDAEVPGAPLLHPIEPGRVGRRPGRRRFGSGRRPDGRGHAGG